MDELLSAYLCEDDGKDEGKDAMTRLKDNLPVEARRIRYNRIPRCARTTTEHSSFVRLLESGDDQALVAATGPNHVTFEYVKVLFAPMYMAYTPYSSDGTILKRRSTQGSKRLLTATQCLGLVLMWTRSRGAGHQSTFRLFLERHILVYHYFSGSIVDCCLGF